MRRTWVVAVVAVGIVLGIAIAGIPNRHHDAPLRIAPSTTAVVGPTSAPTTVAPTTVPGAVPTTTGP
jgi:hypothetical protein